MGALWIALWLMLAGLALVGLLALYWLLESAGWLILVGGLLLLWLLAVNVVQRRAPLDRLELRTISALSGAIRPAVFVVLGLVGLVVAFNVAVTLLVGPAWWLLALTASEVLAVVVAATCSRRYFGREQRVRSTSESLWVGLSFAGLSLCGIVDHGVKQLDWLDVESQRVTQLALRLPEAVTTAQPEGWALGRSSAHLLGGQWQPSSVRFPYDLVDAAWLDPATLLVLDARGGFWQVDESGKRAWGVELPFQVRAMSTMSDGQLLVVGGEPSGAMARLASDGSLMIMSKTEAPLLDVSCELGTCWAVLENRPGLQTLDESGGELALHAVGAVATEMLTVVDARKDVVVALGPLRWVHLRGEAVSVVDSPAPGPARGWKRGARPTPSPEPPRQVCLRGDGTSGWAITKHYLFRLQGGTWTERDWTTPDHYTAIACDGKGGAWVAKAPQSAHRVSYYAP